MRSLKRFLFLPSGHRRRSGRRRQGLPRAAKEDGAPVDARGSLALDPLANGLDGAWKTHGCSSPDAGCRDGSSGTQQRSRLAVESRRRGTPHLHGDPVRLVAAAPGERARRAPQARSSSGAATRSSSSRPRAARRAGRGTASAQATGERRHAARRRRRPRPGLARVAAEQPGRAARRPRQPRARAHARPLRRRARARAGAAEPFLPCASGRAGPRDRHLPLRGAAGLPAGAEAARAPPRPARCADGDERGRGRGRGCSVPRRLPSRPRRHRPRALPP